jgi:hypothetical protein
MSDAEKKATELRVICAARQAGFPLPMGEIVSREEPDFEITADRGCLGIELAAVFPPPRDSSFNSPLAEDALYEKAVRQAELDYSRIPGVLPVKVGAYPWRTQQRRGQHVTMARELVEFVSSHAQVAVHAKSKVALFDRLDELPDGFGVINIIGEPGTWSTGGSGSFTLDHIYRELSQRIAAKNARVSTYRRNLAGSQIWLLLYCGAAVSNGLEIPLGLERWSTSSDFDRVFFFSALSCSVQEIATTPTGGLLV